MDDKLRDRLFKLYELVKRGVAGEQETAQRKLNELLERNNLTIDDLNDDIRKDRYYKYSTEESRLILKQIMFRVVPDVKIYRIKGYRELTCEATDYEHIQIIEMLDFHKTNFKKERSQILNDLVSAYIHKHDLFALNNGDEPKERKPLTDEEKKALLRMANLMDALSDNTYIKKLN